MSRNSLRPSNPPDVRVCPACQAYNLHDATRCFLCGQAFRPAEARAKPAPAPPLSDPELDYAPAPDPDRYDDRDADDGVPAPYPNAETPPDPTTRVALGVALFVVFVGLFRASPMLAIFAAVFLAPPLLKALRGRSRGAPRTGGGGVPSLFGFLGRTLVALSLVGVVFVIAVLTAVFALLGAIFD
jgi:hypothetical protein